MTILTELSSQISKAALDTKIKVAEMSRKKKLDHFYSLSKAGDTVLDVGVAREVEERPPTINYFLKNYRYHPATYTALSIDDLSGMEDLFPGKRFVDYGGRQFPFSDREFDWVFCNAVIEHVGDDDAQLLFLNEMMRVAKNVFFTTPNKYFPIEPHTNMLFLHWNDELFYRLRRDDEWWGDRYSIYPFSSGRLETLLKNSQANSFEIYKNRLMGLPMTFTVTCKSS
jgi:Methyltransferase domain